MYKFVAIDIDGTLLNSSGEISEKTVNTIKKVTDRNIKVILTSGRVTDSVRGIAKKISAEDYIICDNGASIYDLVNSQTIWSREIRKDTVCKLVDMCTKNSIYYMVFSDNEIIVKNLKHMALAFYMQRHNLKEDTSGISEFKYAGLDYIESIDKPIRRIVICDEDREVFKSAINKLGEFEGVSLMASPHISNKIIHQNDRQIVLSYSYAEILPYETNKWVAIQTLIDKLNIKPSEVIAIGDNFNDIQMIQNAGLGVAMNNGAQVAKNVARVIAPSNDEDGVALILERYALARN